MALVYDWKSMFNHLTLFFVFCSVPKIEFKAQKFKLLLVIQK